MVCLTAVRVSSPDLYRGSSGGQMGRYNSVLESTKLVVRCPSSSSSVKSEPATPYSSHTTQGVIVLDFVPVLFIVLHTVALYPYQLSVSKTLLLVTDVILYHTVFLWTNLIHDFMAVTFSMELGVICEKLTLP